MSLKKVVVEQFRGICEPVSFNLLSDNHSGEGSACFIYGQNGSGKTSLCDAIEFALRGSISRRTIHGVKERREMWNMSSSLPPHVKAEFADGRSVIRGKGGIANQPLGDYIFAPIVIRRKDIDSFWTVAEKDRLEFFWDYRSSAEEVRTLNEEKMIKEYRRNSQIVHRLRKRIEVLLRSPRDNYPYVPPVKSDPLTIKRKLNARFSKIKPKISEWERKHIIDEYSSLVACCEKSRPDVIHAQKKNSWNPAFIMEALKGSAESIVEDFVSTTRLKWLKTLSFDIQNDELSIKIYANNSDKAMKPEDVLSEAYLDILILFTLIEVRITLSKKGQGEIIVLDDVFQSVDSVLRRAALEQIVRRLHGWQIISVFHDRIWMENAVQIYRFINGYKPLITNIQSYGFGVSPLVSQDGFGPLRDVDSLVAKNASAASVISASGRALEGILRQLILKFNCKVAVNDFQRATLKTYFNVLDPIFSHCNFLILSNRYHYLRNIQFLRNTEGSHYNDEGDSYTESEGVYVANSLRDFFECVYCEQCGRYISWNQKDGLEPCPHLKAKYLSYRQEQDYSEDIKKMQFELCCSMKKLLGKSFVYYGMRCKKNLYAPIPKINNLIVTKSR